MKIVIYGAGAIGSHIAYCLYSAGHEIFIVTRGANYESIKKNGLIVKIHNNKTLISKNKIIENDNFHVLNSVRILRKIKIETIFITVKLKDYNWNLIKKIKPFLNKKTAIITPCTNIPLWWIINNKTLDNRFKKSSIYNKYKKKYFSINNILGMTMWVSAVIEKPGIVNIRHTQRGYPLKSLSKEFSAKANELRKSLKKYSKSPTINNIYSEIFIKSLNALAFNVVALKYGLNNLKLKKNKLAINDIKIIMNEGEKILKILNIKFSQTANQRIKQTLSSSVHTMSMLNDYNNNKKIELRYLWNSFNFLCKGLAINMIYTENIVKNVLKEIKNH